MIAKQKLNPEIWEFWIRTHKAWLNGALSALDSSFQEAAQNTLMIEHFVDDSPNVVATIRTLAPRPDEFLMGYSSGDCDTLLTNQRLMVRNHRINRHEIYELCDIATCTSQGWWTATVTVVLRNGITRRYPRLRGAIKDQFLRHAIANNPKTGSSLQKQLEPIPPPAKPRTRSLPPIYREENPKTVTYEGVTTMSEKDGDMIGSEHPALQQLIKARMTAEEELLAFATAVTMPTGNLYWVPVVGSLLELGRVAGTKPYLLAVTNKRFLIIQLNRFSKMQKEIREVGFEHVPIGQICRCVAEGRFLDQIYAKDSFKLNLGDGRKYHFRQITKENATVLRDAILRVQNGQA